ncbi:MAG: diaminopimelate decarboxylase [Streptomyces sp.]|nr:diaminopimelate decarboxylase [Streptomyces sp.]
MTDELGTRRAQALSAAVEHALVTEREPVVGLLDIRGIEQSATALRAAFATPGVEITHTFAVKAASLVPVLALLGECGLGAEVASPGELALARAAGIPAGRIVLDSPAKTVAELREALAQGIAVNADNPQELARIDALRDQAPSGSPVGIRINPQVGGGSIEAMSTATATSKFGVTLRDPGAEEWVLRAYAERPWLNRLHTHTGSQGVPLELMTAGVRAAYELAERINAAAGRQQITALDIGGGLPVNFRSDETAPSFTDYADLLRAEIPGLFDGRYGLVTEFGRALLAKNGTVLARVEYAKSAGGRPIAVTHAGAQVATRTVFVPGAWPIRVLALDGKGHEKDGDPVVQDVAGPCCFAGDLVAEARALPLLEAGDHVALLDTGAYYFSNHFAYNSLPRPAIWGYRVQPDGSVAFAPVRPAQTQDELLTESGAGLPPLHRGL